MHYFLRRKQCESPPQSRCFSRACAITLFMEVIQSFISCPRISRADVAENLSLDNRMGCTMKRMQMVPFLLCSTVSFKESKHGTAYAVHNGARQKDQKLEAAIRFPRRLYEREKKRAICLPHSSTTFHNKMTSVSNLTAAQIRYIYGTTGGRKKTDLNLAN